MRYEIRDSKMKYYDKWIAIETHNLTEFLHTKYQEKMHVWDHYKCGDEKIQVVVKSSDNSLLFFEAYNEWYINDNPYECVNEFQLHKITAVNFVYPSIDRDWVILE